MNSTCRASISSIIWPAWWSDHALVTASSADRPAGSTAAIRPATSSTRVRGAPLPPGPVGQPAAVARDAEDRRRTAGRRGRTAGEARRRAGARGSSRRPRYPRLVLLVLPPFRASARAAPRGGTRRTAGSSRAASPPWCPAPTAATPSAISSRPLLELLVPVGVRLVPQVVDHLVVVAPLAGVAPLARSGRPGRGSAPHPRSPPGSPAGRRRAHRRSACRPRSPAARRTPARASGASRPRPGSGRTVRRTGRPRVGWPSSAVLVTFRILSLRPCDHDQVYTFS